MRFGPHTIPLGFAAACVLAAACVTTPPEAPTTTPDEDASAASATPALTSASSAAPGATGEPDPTASAEEVASEAPPATENALASAETAEAEAEGPTSCPDGMVLIEGDYCTEVQHDCDVEWYAPQNKKRVCEKFKTQARCVGKRVKKRYCIDKFAWPNKEGERPEVMNTFYQAQVKCAAAGKRMCTESEWNFACEGPEMKPFPYGYERDPSKCNGDHKWDNPSMQKVARRDPAELARLWRGVPSGSQPECISDFGVHDLPANNDEVVAGEAPRAKYASVHTGGPWYSGVRNQCRPKVYTHSEDFYYYFLGFRCCANPDGEPNEPRTKSQIRDGVSWKTIERLASFNVEQMQRVLELKQRGECECDGNSLPGLDLKGPRWLCKTMCGTLLGPNAKDGDDSTRVLHRSRKGL